MKELREKIRNILHRRMEPQFSCYLADAILELPKFKEMQDKTDKFDSIKELFPDFLEHGRADAQKWVTVSKGIISQEVCNGCDGKKQVVDNGFYDAGEFRGKLVNCNWCNGSGYTERQATAEEIRQFIECHFSYACGGMSFYTNEGARFQLSSGKILMMKGE